MTLTTEERAAIEKRIFLLEQMTVENGATIAEAETAKRKIADLQKKIEDGKSEERAVTKEQKIREARAQFDRFMAELNTDYEKYNMGKQGYVVGDLDSD